VSLADEHVAVLVTDISASGKSTVAQFLAERFPRGVHVRGDVFRRMVVAGREEMTAQPSAEAWQQLRLRYQLGAATVDAYFDAGFSVVVQDVVVGSVLEEYVGLIRSRPLIVVVLVPRLDVVAGRERARPKTGYRDGLDTMNEMDAGLRRDTSRLGLWLDTSDQTPRETVDEIAARAWVEGQVG
jgi:chloramphenicol 3-O-phosphotransferase